MPEREPERYIIPWSEMPVAVQRYIIPWSEMPVAVQRYLVVHHPHMLGRVCEFTATHEGLLIEEVGEG